MFTKILLVFLGGGLGALLRELLISAAAPVPGGFPMPIFIANITASFLIGLAIGLAGKGGIVSDPAKLFITTGVMGGLSTFSSFVWGTVQMLATPGEQATALVYVVLSIVVGFIAVQAGLALGPRYLQARAQSPSNK